MRRAVGAQDALDPEHFMTDGVAVPECGQDLVDSDHRGGPLLLR